ncbi:MAG: RICIN domain-containing protein [Bacteroidales bacterium]|nr:RICIN domain-containing protein [Bacteroidales bacterium]MDD3431663.1 RICIN domain-containing protein [Bacteroidales bacterium]MDD4430521.1 RICIN domain-containing protein [Bacteroidales bacterium]
MNKRRISFYPTIVLIIISLFNPGIKAENTQTFETVSIRTRADLGDLPATNPINPQPFADRSVIFNLSDSGKHTPILWGLDTAWPSRDNILRGVAFMGSENIYLVRASFQPTLPLLDGDLQSQQVIDLNNRLNLINLTGSHTKVALNCDHPSVDSWYAGNAQNWAQLMDVTTRRVQEAGRQVVSIAPFNEPDYGWGQGSMTDFFNIAGELRNNPRFDSIRISGGNTLNTDQALSWYNALKSRLDEGNTHQLAGSFDNYALFFKTVRANGHHATNDELHNVMEAMVGVEYGMQTGIWWGTAELARGEFVKASFGRRLAYAEHRPNWTAASVYRSPEGKVQAFVGSSERQAVTSSYSFVSQDRDVYFDGQGPQRAFTMEIPGGTGYQQGQTNAERVININWGEDVPEPVNGRYVLVNRNSAKVMEVENGSTSAGSNVRQNAWNGAAYQQWNVSPVDPRIVGDYSYYSIIALHSDKSLDIYNWSLNNGGNIIAWDDAKGANQQWYLEYAGDGWFYIRSRHSSHCLQIQNASTANAANIQQGTKNGSANQQWRFLPAGAAIEFNPPAAPTELKATENTFSVHLDWNGVEDNDLAGYSVYRADSLQGPFQTLARNLNGTSFTDHSIKAANTYYYAVKAVDRSLNRSVFSDIVSAAASGGKDLLTRLSFEGNTLDQTPHLNHGEGLEGLSYVEGINASQALALDGSQGFVQLPANLVNHAELSLALWVYWQGGDSWQRIFDFLSDQTSYFYLTPKIGVYNKMRFAIRKGGGEERLEAAALPQNQWCHVAVTLSDSLACLYVNGEIADQSAEFSLSPLDIQPVINYLGRGQYVSVLFKGQLDDFRAYSYPLSPTEVAALAANGPDAALPGIAKSEMNDLTIWPLPARDVLYIDCGQDLREAGQISLYKLNGNKIASYGIRGRRAELDLSGITPGVYLLQLSYRGSKVFKTIVLGL